MFLIKCLQGINQMIGQAAADQFSNAHQDTTLAGLQQILDDYADLLPNGVSYFQDIPERVRGILLERDENGERAGRIWEAVAQASR